MKKEVVLIALGMFLMVFMVGGILAQCQYTENISTGVFVNNLYDNQGNKYTNPIQFNNFINGQSNGIYGCSCKTSFEIKNNIDKTISLNVYYEVSGGGISQKNISLNLDPLFTQIVSEQVSLGSFSIGGCSGGDSCSISPSSVRSQFITNNETISKMDEIINQTCKQCLGKDCLNDGDSCTYDIQCGSDVCSNSGNTAGHCISQRSNTELEIANLESNISSQNQRISTLESWKQTINNTITSIQSSITSILNTLIGYNTRISKIENKTIGNNTIIINNTTTINNTIIINSTTPNNYCKYLSSGDRKNIVCGYAEDNNLTQWQDCGLNCTITYKTTRGRTTSTCKCK